MEIFQISYITTQIRIQIGIQKLVEKVGRMALTFLNRQLLVVMQAFVQLFWRFFAILSTIDCNEIAQFTRPFRGKKLFKKWKKEYFVTSFTLKLKQIHEIDMKNNYKHYGCPIKNFFVEISNSWAWVKPVTGPKVNRNYSIYLDRTLFQNIH